MADKTAADAPSFEAGWRSLRRSCAVESGDLPLERSGIVEKAWTERILPPTASGRRDKVEILLKKGRKLEAEPFELDDDGGDEESDA